MAGERLASRRFYGRVPTHVGTASFFAGVADDQRMKEVRTGIEEVRSAWRDPLKLERIKNGIKLITHRASEDEELRSQVENLLSGFTDWADVDYRRNGVVHRDRYIGL